jgi:hypothetical protein
MIDMLIVVHVLELIVIGSDWTLMVASNMDMVWIFVHMGNCVVSRLRMVDCVSVHVVTVQMMIIRVIDIRVMSI